MKKLLAGVLVFLPMGAAAQDVIVTVNPIEGTFSAEYFGPEVLLQMFGGIAVRLTGDGPISITGQSDVYTSILTPSGAAIAGNGTDLVEFVGMAPGDLLGAPVDSSNPFEPFTFSYGGTFNQFGVEFFSETYINVVVWQLNPYKMVNANGSQGPVSFRIDIVPAPATAALLAFAGVVGARRRR